MNKLNAKKEPAFKLKGSLFTLTVLQLTTTDIDRFATELHATVQKTPNFFLNAPIVVDLQLLAESKEVIPFEDLSHAIREEHLIPIGVKTTNEAQQKAAQDANLAILPGSKHDTDLKSGKKNQGKAESASSMLITQPVRSGQQVYAKNGDLIVIAPVSHGAELLADGHIHVYGALRGRALAGIQGNEEARIFCNALDAELISIAGRYRLKDDFEADCNQGPTQIILKDETLDISRTVTK